MTKEEEDLAHYLSLLFPEPGLPGALSRQMEIMMQTGTKRNLLHKTQSLFTHLLEKHGTNVLKDCRLEQPFPNMIQCTWPDYGIRCGVWDDGIMFERNEKETHWSPV